ncbi:MAG: hypothetical protein PX481_24235 [Microcystis sp. M53603_WE2]|jgi:hypothetical protein|nr:hypothetical protein [Microcystis sp. M53603_WE2]MDJ0541727.1 hypothetical protein [Microcystis sp. M53603_WE2]MDJ0567106.1 hypothetical protein [Microcystis sp. M49629_WE12]
MPPYRTIPSNEEPQGVKSMTTYQDVRRQVENLTPDEQLRLLKELAVMVRRPMLVKPKHSIMELEGLGKEIWNGLDAQEYVNQERASWNG